MILKAKHHPILYPFFTWFGQRAIRSHFREVCVYGDYKSHSSPLLVLANHISWWDGFVVAMLNKRFFKRKLHFMMLRKQLEKHRFLNHCGGFSVEPGSRSILESLRYTRCLLQQPHHMVLIFPQGRITSHYQRQIHFEKGVAYLLNMMCTEELELLLVATFIDYGSYKKPTLSVYMQECKLGQTDIDALQEAYFRFYTTSLTTHIGRTQ